MKKKILIILLLVLTSLVFCACTPTEGVDTGAKVIELENKVEEIKKWLDTEKISLDVVDDLELPTMHPTLGGAISWQSSRPEIIESNGKYHVPAEQTKVILTATIKFQFQEFDASVAPIKVERTWTKTVNALTGENVHIKEIVKTIDERLQKDAIIGDLGLPTDKLLGASVSWGSSMFSVVGSETVGWVLKYPPKQPSYTTLITLTALITYNGRTYEKHFVRSVKGVIDLPDDSQLDAIIDQIPTDKKLQTKNENSGLIWADTYLLPGGYSFDAERDSSATTGNPITDIKDIKIKWSVEDGDKRGLDIAKNRFVRLSTENKMLLKAEFYLDLHVVHERQILRTIPAATEETQQKYLKEFLRPYIPNTISGNIMMPCADDLYNFTFEWTVGSPLKFGEKGITEFRGNTFVTIEIDAGAGPALIHLDIERNGKYYDAKDYAVKVVGSSEVFTAAEISKDSVLFGILKTAFGNDKTDFTKKDFLNIEAYRKIDYALDLSKGSTLNPKGDIKDVSMLKYAVGLKWLNLAGNDNNGNGLVGVTTLSTLTGLEQLNLSGCGIKNANIEGSPFSAMPLLEGLDLSHNNLTSIEFLADKTTQYASLDTLYLHDNKGLADISPLAVKGPLDNNAIALAPKLLSLTLSGNAISTIDSLQYAKELRMLWLADNEITDIKPLRQLSKLNILTLSNNHITNLAPISTALGLRELYLDNIGISDITYLKNLSNLSILSLANNNINNIGELADKTELQYLDLDGNKIGGTGTFEKLTKLKFLFLENNNISTISNNISALKNLKELRLNNNNIQGNNLAATVGELTELTYLSLSGNTELKDISFLSKLTKLEQLELANTGIIPYRQSEKKETTADGKEVVTTVDTNNLDVINTLKALKVLDLSNNGKIVDISVLVNLGNLTTFYIDNCCFQQQSAKNDGYSDALKQMSGLVNLSMQNCPITTLGWLDGYNELQYLDIRGNKIKEIDVKSFSSKTSLRELYIDSSLQEAKIIDIDSLKALTNLTKLSMQNCSIGKLDWVKDNLGLTYLDIRGHNIQEINASDFSFNINITELYLDASLPNARIIDIYQLTALENLTKLSIQNFSIDKLDWIKDHSKLTSLDIRGHNIQEININDFSSNTILTELFLDSRLPDATIINIDRLSVLENLVKFSIANYSIETLDWMAGWRNLQYLNIIGNRIQEIDANYFSFNINLTELYLDSRLPDAKIINMDRLKALENLTKLSIQNFSIETLDWMADWHNLQYLNIVGNNIHAFEDWNILFNKRDAKVEIYLYNNTAPWIPEMEFSKDTECGKKPLASTINGISGVSWEIIKEKDDKTSAFEICTIGDAKFVKIVDSKDILNKTFTLKLTIKFPNEKLYLYEYRNIGVKLI